LQASSTLVNVAEHAEVHLVHLLAESAPSNLLSQSFTTDCENCIANADAPGLLRTVLGDGGALTSLFAIDPIEESVSAFSLLASLLDRVTGMEAAKLATEISDIIGNDNRFDPCKRIAMLAALYNLRADGTEKCRLLAKIVRLCAASAPHMLNEGQPLGDMIEPEALEKQVDFWDVSVEERRILYRAVVDGIGSVAEGAKRRQRLLILLVGTYTDSATLDAAALTASKEAAVGAIRDPVTLFDDQRGMSGMPAVAALGDSTATKPLLALLEIFAEGKLEDFTGFLSSNGNIIDAYGLSKEDCIRHMRLLSLCSLAAEHEEIPYSAIASTLQVDATEVEGWVITAVSSGLLSAKMDQLQQVVMVERCVVRKFNIEQWKALQTKLNAWKKNVRGVLEGLKQSQVLTEGNVP